MNMKSERKQASQSKAAVRNENENEMYTWRELIKLIVLCRPAKFLSFSTLLSLQLAIQTVRLPFVVSSSIRARDSFETQHKTTACC